MGNKWGLFSLLILLHFMAKNGFEAALLWCGANQAMVEVDCSSLTSMSMELDLGRTCRHRDYPKTKFFGKYFAYFET